MSSLAVLSNLDTLNTLALLAVVFIGLPHGAMDGALAVHFGWMKRPLLASTFLITYVGLAAVVVLLWSINPVMSFVVFLAISVYHFGRGDSTSTHTGRETVESLARGGLVIAGISHFHPAEADAVFTALVGSTTAGVWLFLDAVLILTALCFVESMLFKQQGERNRFLLEMGFLSVVFISLPPLAGFAVYFCLVHSMRHFSAMRGVLQATVSTLRVTQTTVVFSLLTWAFGLLVFAQRTASVGVEPALLQVVFIGLAALTVPHMVLVDGWLNRVEPPAAVSNA
jgi:Brp/Blh family beta-carotene 15,15'-monooxygenase